MASSQENLVFGNFEDLCSEESQRIYNILYGNKAQSGNKVEFPWDAGTEELQGAVGGGTFVSQSWIGDVEKYEESGLGISFQQTSHLDEPGYSGQFSFTDPADIVQAEQGDGSATSKLQASLKPYERRNKKKRPPDYYNRQSAERETRAGNQTVSSYTVTSQPGQVGLQNVYRPEMQMNMPAMQINNAPGDYNIGYQPMVENNVNMQGQNSNYNTSVHAEFSVQSNFVNTTCSANAFSDVNKRNDVYPNDGELCEVIVEPCPQNPVKILARPETYEVQDHERTSSDIGVESNVMETENSQEGVQIVETTTAIPNSVLNISANTEVTAPASDLAASGLSSQNRQVVNENIKTNEPAVSQESDSSQAHDATDSSVSEIDGNCSGKPQVENVMPEAETAQNDPSSDELSKPKPRTWAGLFKGPAGAARSPLVTYTSAETADKTEKEERQEKEYSPVPVPAAEDSNAKHLGELLSRMSISHTSVALQPRGLINRGNWCYINGTLQALVACPPFYNLLKKMPRYPALSRGPSSTPILDAFVEFVHEFQAMPRQEKSDRGKGKASKEIAPGAPFEPAYVYKMLQTIAVNPHFKLGKQEDAEEFLSCVLDGMHEEMSAVVSHSRPDLEAESAVEEERFTNGFVHADEGDEETEEEEQWEQVGPKKKSVLTRRANFSKSPIADIFAGMVRSAVYKAKAKETATLEPFFTLQLDIQSEKVLSLKEALEGLVSSEPISGYTCPKTNAEVEVTKKLSLEELPPVLILHLKFFVYNKDGGSQKLTKRVDYPVELEITKDLLSPNAKNKLREHQRTYKLFAVVYHHGKAATGGHYTTSVFHPGINGWIHSDDSTVKTVTVAHVLKYQPTRVPYLLYYRRLDSQ